MLSPVLCSDAALKKNSFSGWPSAFSSLCAHSKYTLDSEQGSDTNYRSCKGHSRHMPHTTATSQTTAKCQDFMEWLHALDPSHVPYNAAWLWWARSQAMHVERIGLVLFPAAWSTVAAITVQTTVSAGSHNGGSCFVLWFRKWGDGMVNIKTEKYPKCTSPCMSGLGWLLQQGGRAGNISVKLLVKIHFARPVVWVLLTACARKLW